MPTPRLLHPIPVYLRNVQPTETAATNAHLHEPVGQPQYGDPVKLRAQVHFGYASRAQADKYGNGVSDEYEGYLVFLLSDLRTAGFTVALGDLITQIGEGVAAYSCRYVVSKIRRSGHYPSAQGATLLKVFFSGEVLP